MGYMSKPAHAELGPLSYVVRKYYWARYPACFAREANLQLELKGRNSHNATESPRPQQRSSKGGSKHLPPIS